ncbi:store-operated calcium entry-associated regulatory factor [Hyalella azteca]|uniref:Store-operated calcium entry-associated regulatory factor n=1 Tax=Hyalella azteca TaxID=294128 RepID=A0A8B7NN98_HYAAZ|nr:store-operated calcium entry-associated regulatory factor [Hyalella azteca]
MKSKPLVVVLVCLPLFLFNSVDAWLGESSVTKVLLKDVQALTLYAGKMTNGRRSAAVPQLECVTGGSAPCSTFKPRVVQCTNKGFDGIDVQWECKTDMDGNVRFGHIDVSCEGYDYPEDPYILAGSCGLRYSLDYTRDGSKQGHDYGYGPNEHSAGGGSYGWKDDLYGGTKTAQSRSFTSGFADLIAYCAMGLMAWAFYKTCISPPRGTVGDRSDSTTNDDYPAGGGGGYGWNLGGGGGLGGTGGAGGHYQGYDDASCHARRNAGGGGGGGGFWTGAAAGGLLGYMLGGNRQGGGHYNRGYNRGWFGGGGGGGFNTGGGGWGGGGSGFGGGSGTRTASGFGGTSRR